jgi:hypothetical protein
MIIFSNKFVRRTRLGLLLRKNGLKSIPTIYFVPTGTAKNTRNYFVTKCQVLRIKGIEFLLNI